MMPISTTSPAAVTGIDNTCAAGNNPEIQSATVSMAQEPTVIIALGLADIDLGTGMVNVFDPEVYRPAVKGEAGNIPIGGESRSKIVGVAVKQQGRNGEFLLRGVYLR